MCKISVIIPVYNRETTILRCLDSLKSQTFDDYEIIIINDGSTDKSEELINEYSGNFRRFQYISIDNNGVSNARNIGILKSNGKYVTFLDSDDTYQENFLASMYNQISINDADACFCGHFIVNSYDEKKKAKIYFKKSNLLINYLKNKTTPNTNSWIIRRDFLINKRLFFEVGNNLGEDMIFFTSLILVTKNINFVKAYLTNYYISTEDSLSKKIDDKVQRDFLWMNKLKKNINDSDISTREKHKSIKIIERYRLPVGILNTIFYSNNSFEEKKKLFKKNKNSIKKMKLVNGVRSLKGLLIYLYFSIK
ncbi:glycosyltransferase family 2 protein [Enterococcus faecium]|uniref:glycosyltransferase family 2 protein n=3 Tax=Enterococcus TaxID=1350 RepID=UPI001A906E20|nr:glycosyltransferase family 2 protein [Enterococcus casseliflavus]MBO0425717.1 glycosyltransferase family 2 protein [Enterococcus faecium]MBO6349783.1 glycosyltransferase family 2 protein [Enterococcus casseliflavus]MBO6367927.1 glycosyltransferase family 2 protein [Enterococcus casseliflavus]MCD5200369.1 glycosyltransferase family 2 protein [Enterococcus casseliflavus]